MEILMLSGSGMLLSQRMLCQVWLEREFRILLAAVTALFLVLGTGNAAIRWLRRRFRERIVSDSPTLNQHHADKQGTPTMGGLIVIFATLVSTSLWANLRSTVVWLGIALVVSMTVLGGYDDWIKARTSRPGLTVRQKFRVQVLVGLLIGGLVYVLSPTPVAVRQIDFPAMGVLKLSGFLIVVWFALVLISAPNAVNLTDGLDGLAAGCTFLTSAAMTLVCVAGATPGSMAAGLSRFGPETAEFAVLTAALSGAMLGFLWFNRHPARVFMGDTGALPAGGLLGLAGVLSGAEIILAVAGGVFVIETLSVMAQVFWFRRTGRRILLCSPLHNHFVFQGLPERTIVARFWLLSVVFAMASLLILRRVW